MADGTSEANLYEALGVPRSATPTELKRSYRALARTLHPDRRPGDREAEERFKRVTYAYQILHDPARRRLYDEFGAIALREGFDPDAYRAWQRRARSAGFRGSLEDLLGKMRDGGRVVDLGELLSSEGLEEVLAERPSGRRAVRRGRDLSANVRVGFVEALRGIERELAITAPVIGARTIRTRIPAGVRDGDQLRVRGQGAPARRGRQAGDLVLTVRVDEHPVFWREGDDLHLRLPVTAAEAYRGARVPVPTLDGEVTVAIPPGAPSGARLRIRGKGAPRRGAEGSGDLFAHVQLTLPRPGDRRVSELLEEVERARGEDVRAGIHL